MLKSSPHHLIGKAKDKRTFDSVEASKLPGPGAYSIKHFHSVSGGVINPIKRK